MSEFGTIALSSDCEHWELNDVAPHVAIRLKQLFPSIPKGSTCPYKIRHTDIADSDLQWFSIRYPLVISDRDRHELHAGCSRYQANRRDIERIQLPTFAPTNTARLREGQLLRQYQWQAIEILRIRHNLLIGDEGGLGKTYTAAGFLTAVPGTLPAAVVCDSHMQEQWRDKIEAFTFLRVHLIKCRKPYTLPVADVYVFRISQVSGWPDIFNTQMFKTAIYDEPQSLRNGTRTDKGKACAVLSRHAIYRAGLSATPVYNYGDEMWRIMHFIDAGVLGSWEDFAREWCTPIGSNKFKINDPKALGSFLREEGAMIRRLKSDVGLQLPKVSRIVEHVDYDQETVDRVEALAQRLAIKATTATFVERGSAVRELDIMVRRATGLSKAKAVAQFTRILVDAGEPVVLFGWHRDVYDIWLAELADLNPAMYTGSESVNAKESAKERFCRGEAGVMIISLRSGAGVDGLQHRCSTIVFGELDWSPGIHQQCIWRVDREGQTSPVTVFFLVTDDGSDPVIMDVLGIKASEASAITDPHLGVQVVNTDTANLQKLVQRYLDKKRA
jgi:hypothetical protein